MSTGILVEGYVADQAFADLQKSINPILVPGSVNFATLTPKAMSYFVTPAFFKDNRTPSTRAVNWTPSTQANLIVDSTTFSSFTNLINDLASPITAGFFKIIDKLIFNYNASNTPSQIETALLADSAIAAIYVPGSQEVASTVVTDTVYYSDGTTASVTGPTFVRFSIVLPSGSTTQQFDLTLFAEVNAWLDGYGTSTILSVIPPLPYADIYSSSLTLTTDNIFSTSTLSANLSYTTSVVTLGVATVSGITEFSVWLHDDAGNRKQIPFNIIFKGQKPTAMEMREAIKAAVLGSGIGTEAGWEDRIPGLFLLGRIYVVPMWSQTFQKTLQKIYPSINVYTKLASITNKVLQSLQYGDVSFSMDVLSAYYNKMRLTAVPDRSTGATITMLSTLCPDYQDFSPSNQNFFYLSDDSKDFAIGLNAVLALDYTGTTNPLYPVSNESLFSFYSFVIDQYEICVITQESYNSIMESTS